MSNRNWKPIHKPIEMPDGGQAQSYVAGYLRAIVSQDGPDGYWHLSVSHTSGIYPNWDQVADARYDLVPHDVDMALILPPPGDYVNAHEAVLQLTEVRDENMPIDRRTGMVRTKLTENRKRGEP